MYIATAGLEIKAYELMKKFFPLVVPFFKHEKIPQQHPSYSKRKS